MKNLFIIVSIFASVYLLSQIVWGKQTVHSMLSGSQPAANSIDNNGLLNKNAQAKEMMHNNQTQISTSGNALPSDAEAFIAETEKNELIKHLIAEIEQLKKAYDTEQKSSKNVLADLQAQIDQLHSVVQLQNNTPAILNSDDSILANKTPANENQEFEAFVAQSPANENTTNTQNINEKRIHQAAILRDVSQKMELAALSSLSQ